MMVLPFSMIFLVLVGILIVLGVETLARTRPRTGRWVWSILGVLAVSVLIVAIRTTRMETEHQVARQHEAAAAEKALEAQRRALEQTGRTAEIDASELRPEGDRGEPATAASGLTLTRARRPVVEVSDDRAAWDRVGEVTPFRPLVAPPRQASSTTQEPPWKSGPDPGRWIREIGGTWFIYCPPGDGHHVSGWSGQHATRDRALEDARAKGAEKLAALALIELESRRPEIDAPAAYPLAREVAARRASRMDSHFEVAQLRYAGEVHRVAVQYDASPSEISAIASETDASLREGWIANQRTIQQRVWLAVLAVFGCFVVFVVYAFLDAGTKGWFAWPLRIAAGCVLLALAAIVYHASTRLS